MMTDITLDRATESRTGGDTDPGQLVDTTSAITGDVNRSNSSNNERILLVGPLPPPMTGPHVTFDIVCRDLREYIGSDRVDVIDTSQKQLKGHTRIASWGNLRQAGRILRKYRRRLRTADRVLVFGSNGFMLSLAPLLVLLAKRSGKPVSLHAFGGSLDRFHTRLNPVTRSILNWAMRNSHRVAVETELLRSSFEEQLGDRVQQVSNLRDLTDEMNRDPNFSTDPGRPLRLVFFGIVREEKGILVLLQCLRKLAEENSEYRCDIYGPLWPSFADQFEKAMRGTPNANYKGVVDPDDVVKTMADYDVMVFPTHYQGEGHPGVVIESMFAGIVPIATSHRSIPELITHRENGLLVPTHDPGFTRSGHPVR